MKSFFLYRKWNFILFLNNLLTFGFYTYNKKFFVLKFDINQSLFWIYKKKKKFQNVKIINLKKRFSFL